MLKKLGICLVHDFAIKCRKFTWSPENRLVFYKCEQNTVIIYNYNKKKVWYSYQFGSETAIKHINWSDIGENLVVIANGVIVFNIFTQNIEFRYITDSGRIIQAYLLTNRKLLLELVRNRLQLIDQFGQLEITYFFTAYKKYKNRVFLLFNGVLYTLNINLKTLDQYVVSFNQVNSFNVYNRKVYLLEKIKQDKSDVSYIIRGRDFAFYLENELDSFQISKKFLFAQKGETVRVFNKHSQEDILTSGFSDFYVDADNERLFILNKGILKIYDGTKTDYSFKLIDSRKVYIEEEHEFDSSDDTPDINWNELSSN